MKVCFTSSSGGHFEQLMMLKELFKEYDSFVVTEKTKYSNTLEEVRTYFIKQVNRRSILFVPLFFYNLCYSIYILLKEKPKLVISTGVLSTIPICIFAKLYGAKLIYIESFAKINTGTITGKIMYKFADIFYVQWEQMLEIYPKAKYIGGIY